MTIPAAQKLETLLASARGKQFMMRLQLPSLQESRNVTVEMATI